MAAKRQGQETSRLIRGVLLDLGGVVYVGDEPLPGAVAAVERLKGAGVPVRYITNTTRTPRRLLVEKLKNMNLPVREEELFMPAAAAHRYLRDQGLRPHPLVHPALGEDLTGLPEAGREAVVVGDAGDGFTYQSLNRAFRALQAGAPFLALARNRNFKDADGELSLDAGPFVAALEYATGRDAVVLGKPAPDFFQSAVADLGCAPEQAVMIGDDVESDVGGAMAAGLHGLLVQTGKYKDGDEARIEPPPTAVARNLAEAVAWIVERLGRQSA